MISRTISHYKITKKLGSGGMGIVYKAQDLKLDRPVALKFLPPHLTTSDEEKQRFIHEAKAASALQHNNICAIHEIDETEDGQIFICMDYYEGETLNEKVTQKPLPIEETIDITIQIAQGLIKAHEKEIVHRDIKPANIMFTDDGVVKILDFGLAKLSTQTKLTKEGTTLGTVAYMSPEQARGDDVDHRTDIWSLGVILFEMLTGQLPFKGDYDQALVYSIINDEIDPITGFRTGLPVELERIVNKSLTKSPDERYQHIDEMLTDLKRLRKELEVPGKTKTTRITEEKTSKSWLKNVLIPIGILLLLFIGYFLVKPLFFEDKIDFEPINILVISFQNQTGDESYNYLREAIPNLLITDLEQSRYLRVTTWERMYDILKQIGKEEVKVIDKDLGFELCRRDGIDAIVLGSYIKAGDRFATDVKVLDVRTKKLLKSARSQGEGAASILKNQIDYLSEEISEGVGLSASKIESVQLRIADVTTTSMEAYNYFLRGREDYFKHYIDDSRQFLEKAVELDSSFAIAYLYLAWAYRGLGNMRAKNQAYEKAKTFAEKTTDKERLQIDVAYAFYIEEDSEKGFFTLKQIVKKYPKEKRFHSWLAYRYRLKKLYYKAIDEYNKALELDPSYGDAINGLAYIYANMGNLEKAIEYFKRYASASPGDANPLDSMAELYFKMGQLDEAIEKFKQALEVKPDFGAEWRIAYVYAMKENYVETIRYLNHYIARAPSPGLKAQGYWLRGFYHFWISRFDQSIKDNLKAKELWKPLKHEWGVVATGLSTGCIYYDKGEYELSRSYFKKVLDYVKDYRDFNLFEKALFEFILGSLDMREGNIDSAKARFDGLKALLPQLPERHYWKEQTNISYNMFQMEVMVVEGAYENAIDIGEDIVFKEVPNMSLKALWFVNIPSLQDVLARAYIHNRELDKAITEYEKLITFDPNSKDRRLIHPKYHYRLAKLYQEKGWPEKAIKEYEKLLEVWKDADKDLPELVDAKKRLASIKKTQMK
jgi:serine/threonine protein kinase/tetratricopeptide (TPR) repeat protein